MRAAVQLRTLFTVTVLSVASLAGTACRKGQGRPPVGKTSKSLADSADQIIFGPVPLTATGKIDKKVLRSRYATALTG